MTSKYEFDAERWLRNWSARKRFTLADGRDPFAMCADELHRLRMAVDLHEQGAELMREEMRALEKASVHIYNSGYHAGHHHTVEGGYVDIHSSDMDTYHAEEVAELLAALAGEG